jgi:hypothetical protein
VRDDVGVFAALAYREFESWFITACEALRGIHGMPDDLLPPDEPERIRDAKGWLSYRMDVACDPVTHQIEFTRKIDLDLARASRSFGRLYRFIGQLADD